MKPTMKQTLVSLSVLLLLPIFGMAQDRGNSIGPAPIGGGQNLVRKDGNQINVTHGNGYKKISVKESHRDIDITIHVDGRIKVDITHQFGPDSLESLIRRAPELEKYVRSFPMKAGNKSVRLSV